MISRILEKLIYNQLYDNLDVNELLNNRQSGFRSLHSVATCLLKSTDGWCRKMDNSRYTAFVFIDLKKALDTVDHSMLLKKMGKYDSKGIEMSWFQSCFKFCSQFCRVKGKNSETQNIEIGAPQGSFLGPFLFLQKLNDLPFTLKHCQASMYADDTTVSFSTRNVDDLITTVNNDLKSLEELPRVISCFLTF